MYKLLIILLMIPAFATSQKSSAELKEIEDKLFESKKILDNDNGELWGHQIWSDSILVIDSGPDIVYSLINLEGSEKVSDHLYALPYQNSEVQYTNTIQKFKGGEYVTVIDSYAIDDRTTIHELFHKMHFSFVDSLRADAISYLDEYKARLYLRTELKALNNSLELMNTNAKEDTIKMHIHDALIFRKLRQNIYKDLQKELELETVEGLAVYTEFNLSKVPNKHLMAMEEIEERSKASSLTRSFAYATGGAYGLIFDYLGIDWRPTLETRKVYNFLEIYETLHLKEEIKIDEIDITGSESRNNFAQINEEELKRKEENDKIITYYNEILFDNPALKISIEQGYPFTFDMNSIFGLQGKGTVYTSISGTDPNQTFFGDFELKSELGKEGAFMPGDYSYIIFPLPLSIKENTIIGNTYKITLNKNWEVKEIDKIGNLEIVKK